MKLPELVGHRGYPLHYPENTLVGFAAAIAAGARHIETDVQLTSDQVPVLFHDRDLKRICDVAGKIHELTSAQLQHVHAAETDRFGYKFAQEPVPTLSALAHLLAQHPPVTGFIEVKRIAVQRFGNATVLTRMLRDLKPVLKQCVLISYSLETLLAARQQGWPRLGVVIDRWRERRQPIIADIRPEFLFCDADGLPRFGKLSFAGAKIAVYEVTHDAPQALKLTRRGVDLVETFAIGELKAEIDKLTQTS